MTYMLTLHDRNGVAASKMVSKVGLFEISRVIVMEL